jgi:hypothetical protein
MRRRLNVGVLSSGSAAAPSDRLLSLPPELLSHVLSNLPPLVLGRAAAVCRSLAVSAREPSLWRPHCLALWPGDDFASGAPSAARYGQRHRLMRGVRASGTHLSADERSKAARLLEALGGAYEDDLTTASTHLLCNAAFTSKTRAAHATRGKTQVVAPDWLWRSVAEGRRRPEREHRVPPLRGAVVAVSGVPAAVRDSARQLVTRRAAHCRVSSIRVRLTRAQRRARTSTPARPFSRRGGGEFSESFRHRHATHLLTLSLGACASDKLGAARAWRVPVLHLRWLWSSSRAGACLDPAPYALPAGGNAADSIGAGVPLH